MILPILAARAIVIVIVLNQYGVRRIAPSSSSRVGLHIPFPSQ